MAGTTYRLRRGFLLALIGVICATTLIPATASADTNLVIGGQAVIAYANGDQVRLRQDIGYESPVLANYAEGTWVSVLDGPLTDSEGNFWYQVAVGDQSAGGLSGYIVADFLALESGVSLETVAAVQEETTEPAEEEASAPAAGAVIGVAYVAGTNGDGVRCRADASASAPVITVVPEGSTVELIGVPVDTWQPINCAGSGGFVSLQFISYNLPTVPASDPAVPEETPAAPAEGEETPTDTPEGAETPEETDTTDPIETPAPAPAGTITGSKAVSGTNGDGVRCRSRAGYDGNVITVVPEGRSVDLNGEIQGEWQPVYCGGTTGFIYAAFLGNTPSSAEDDSEGAVEAADLAVGGPTGSATVSGTNGDGVRCRSAASTTSSTIVVLTEGTNVSLNGGSQGSWQPVICSGQSGFVSSQYLTVSGTAPSGTNTTTQAAAATGTAVVNSTGGLNCRSTGSMTAPVIVVLMNGSSVNLRSGSTAGWQAVICGGQNGFAASSYLSFNGAASGSGNGTSGSGSGSTGYTAGASLKIANTDGGGLRLRSSAGYTGSVLAVIGEGSTVTVRSGSTGEWVAVSYSGMNGFVHKDFVTTSTGSSSGSGSTPTTPPSSTGSTSTLLANGDHARVTSSLNLRYSASYSAGVAAVAPAGTVVKVTGSASNGFYPVDWDGLKGFMHGDYLTKTTQALSERGGSASQPTSPGGTQSGTGAGNSIVDYAMRYIGYPYVWATAGPSSFDCSGFINWVVKNVVGRDIGRGLFTQVAAGSAVSRSSLQPGDLVFFQNTYQPGLSHGGIYIGNNQFIHASNPSTGVMISDLNASYYASRWYGAVRLR